MEEKRWTSCLVYRRRHHHHPTHCLHGRSCSCCCYYYGVSEKEFMRRVVERERESTYVHYFIAQLMPFHLFLYYFFYLLLHLHHLFFYILTDSSYRIRTIWRRLIPILLTVPIGAAKSSQFIIIYIPPYGWTNKPTRQASQEKYEGKKVPRD